MGKEVEITGGKVKLRPFINRKTFREYNAIMYKGIKQDLEGEVKVEIPLTNIEEANDVLVLNMIESAEIGGQNVEVNEAFAGNLKQTDFNKILVECNRIMNAKEKKTDESSNKPESTSKTQKAQ